MGKQTGSKSTSKKTTTATSPNVARKKAGGISKVKSSPSKSSKGSKASVKKAPTIVKHVEVFAN